jgi:carbonic anhydrase
MSVSLLATIILSLTMISGCRSNQAIIEEVNLEENNVTKNNEVDKDIWGWDYSGERGPENWSKLNRQYEMCESGKMQSPINLIWHKPESPNPLKMTYAEGSASLINTGYTFRMEMTPQSSIFYNGNEYLLEKIEFRTPSEHKLSGNQLPMEIQFYHRTSNGLKQAIISLLVVSGKGSAWFDRLWETVEGLPKFKSSKIFQFNPDQLIPPKQTFYQYEGSLTHPPCLEGVQWFIFNTPLQLSKEQIEKFRSLYSNNNRPIQNSTDRKIRNF